MKTWDVIVVGGGLIGLSLALALRKRGASVLVVERGEPGQEASHAAAGMLADCGAELPVALRPLATASAGMYPEFVHELQDESGMHVDLRDAGTLQLEVHPGAPVRLAEVEPSVHGDGVAVYLPERSVDPRALTAAALKAAKHREVDISSGSTVTEVLITNRKACGVRTTQTSYSGSVVVNCAGAWAGQLPPHSFPARPVKGQILSVIGAPALKHVVRAPEVYLVPRSDGRIVIGATSEEAGFDKRTDPQTIQTMLKAATRLMPGLSAARIHEAWAGLRPGTPDGLPLLGETETAGYFVATGHFRDGILLAPATAQAMASLILDSETAHDLSPFSPHRFAVDKLPIRPAV